MVKTSRMITIYTSKVGFTSPISKIVLVTGGHAKTFCSVQQFHMCCFPFTKTVVSVKDSNHSDYETLE